MKHSTNISASGHYQVYQNGNLITSFKNKLTDLFLQYFNDVGSSRANMTEISYNNYNSDHKISEINRMFNFKQVREKLGVSNQINLTIRENDDNFAFSELVNYSEDISKNALSLLKLKPVEYVNDDSSITIKHRHCYFLPKKNIGNITGFGIYGPEIDSIKQVPLWQNNPSENSFTYSLLSVSHVRDSSGFKGTVSHTESDNTYIVYTIEYQVNLDSSCELVPINLVNEYQENFGFIRLLSAYNDYGTMERHYRNGYYDLKKYSNTSFIVNDIAKTVFSKPVDCRWIQRYFEDSSENKNFVGDIIGNNWLEASVNNIDTKSINISYTYYCTEKAYISFVATHKPFDNADYQFIENNEPYYIKVSHGPIMTSNPIEVTTRGLKRIKVTFNMLLTINEFEVYDD